MKFETPLKSFVLAISLIIHLVPSVGQPPTNPDKYLQGINLFYLGDSIPKSDSEIICATKRSTSRVNFETRLFCKVFSYTSTQTDSILVGDVHFSIVFLETGDNQRISFVDYIKNYYTNDLLTDPQQPNKDFTDISNYISAEFNVKSRKRSIRSNAINAHSEVQHVWKVDKTIFSLRKIEILTKSDLRFVLDFSYKPSK